MLELHRDLTEERKALRRDIEEISLTAVDHAVFRTAQLAAVVFIVLCAWTVLLLLLARRLFSTGRKAD